MAIEEKKVPLEFTFTPSGCIEPSYLTDYEIMFEPDKIKRNGYERNELTIRCGDKQLDCPIELLTEVIDFLTKKGVIEPKIPSGSIPRIAVGTAPPTNTLPLPVIDGAVENVVSTNNKVQPTVTPFTSFDNNQVVDVETIVSEIVVADAVVGTLTSESPIIKVGNEEVITDEIKARPLITTRAGEGDTEEDILKAEREAAEMRGIKESTFRRAD
jgi:hypothetical protein